MNRVAISAIAIVVCAGACATTTAGLKTDFQSTDGVDFAALKSFQWGDNSVERASVASPIDTDEALDTALKSAIESRLVAKGFSPVEGDAEADFQVTFALAVADQTKQVHHKDAAGRTREYQVANLIVKVRKPSEQAADELWRGTVHGASFETKADAKLEKLEAAVTMVMDGFPPPAAE